MNLDLIIPIYIDTNSLLDLLASIEGGFSIIEKVTTRNLQSGKTSLEGNTEAGAEFGIPNVLNLLKLNVGLSGSRTKETETHHQVEAERYHTYGSLFYRLREYLEDQKTIKRLQLGEESWQALQYSDFVEIHGLFRPNPLVSSLEMMDRLITMYELTTQPIQTPPRSSSKKRHRQSSADASSQAAEIAQVRGFIREILDDIQKEKTQTFIVDLDEFSSAKAVTVLFLDYLRDKTLSEISNKEYYLLGKVVRKIDQEEDATIDLLQGTALSGMGDEAIAQFTSSFSEIPGMNFPSVDTKIAGPALEIVPIAIFV